MLTWPTKPSEDSPEKIRLGSGNHCDDGYMHLTVSEAAAFGASAAAIISAVAARLGQRSSTVRDHLTRLWERETDIYESILVEASSWKDVRADGTRFLQYRRAGDQEVLISPETDLDEAKRRRMWLQIEMFGRPEVRRAFDSQGESHKEWILAYITLRSSYKQNQDADTGMRPPCKPFDATELERQREIARKAKATADADYTKLIEVIRDAVQQVPRRKKQRRDWASRGRRSLSHKDRASMESKSIGSVP
jgi:hypothetical protein